MPEAACPFCPFCEIVAGRAPATFVYTWPDAIAIVPHNPVTEGHTLVIPRVHVANFATDPEVSAVTMRRAAEAAGGLRPDGPMNLITSWGAEEGQTVAHLVIELIPREQGADIALPATLERPDCPVCLSFRVRRSGRELLTCGSPTCGYEMRTRKLRGNVYGDRGGGPTATENIGYSAAHARARKRLLGQPCAEADDTCSGRLEAALRPDLPEELLRTAEDGARYYSGLDAAVGYRNLCRSHHSREGHLAAALRRNPELRASRAAEWARKTHGPDCPSDCTVCGRLRDYDTAVAALVDALVPREVGDGLALPWYSGKGSKGH